MTHLPVRRSVLLSASLLVLALPAASCLAQTATQTSTKTTTTTPATGTGTTQGVTGTDPQPIKWPPSLHAPLGIK